MAQVIVREGENLESALKRFKRSCARDGVMSELRKREHYEKKKLQNDDCCFVGWTDSMRMWSESK